jgi:hypothetical protein
MESSALMRLPKEELAIAYEEAVAERPLPAAAEAVIAGGVAMGVGFADAQIGDGEGALAAGLALGASFATMVATGGEGNLGKTARASFMATSAALCHTAGRALGLKARAERAKKLQLEKAKEAAAAAAAATAPPAAAAA